MITAAERRAHVFAATVPLPLYLIWATLAVYAVTLDFGYVFDDHLALPRIPQYHWYQFLLGVDRRPLTLWSYELAQSPAIQHAINLLLHLGNAGLFYRLLRRWTVAPSAALVALAVFLLHPLQVETVAYVSGRADVFIVLGLLIALHGVERAPMVPWRWYWWRWAPLIVLGIGICCAAKPSGVAALLPLVLIHKLRRPWHASTTWQVWVYWLPVVIVCTAYLTIRGVTDLHGWDWQARVATQVVGAWHWLGMVVLPSGLTADHNLQALPPVLVEIGTLSIAFVVVGSWRWFPTTRLLWIWLAATLGWRILLSSSEWLSEGDGYLPMLGVAVAIGIVVDSVWTGDPHATDL